MIIDRLRQQAATRPRRVLLPESDDPRIIDAAAQLAASKLAIPVLMSPPAAPLPGVEVFSLRDDAADWSRRVDEVLAGALATQGAAAVEQGRHNLLMRAAALLRLGYVDAAVSGSVAVTADVLRAGIKGVGLAPGSKLVSSFFLMELPDRVLTYADCAVVPEPSAEQLAQIAVAAAASHQRLTGELPRVALLSFSTHGSAEHPRVLKVREAVAVARQISPTLAIDGELQFDAALIPGVAQRKAPGSAVAGQANVFVFPDLDAANIGYKITERLAGANAIGPFLQGLSKPWMDLSRGCKAEDVVNVAAIAGLLAE